MCEFCSNAYHLSDAKWGTGEYGTPGGTVTWAFAEKPGTGFGFADYITDPAYRAVIREAFQAWEDVADIDFVEVSADAGAEIELGWDTIDGGFGVVGEAASRGYKTTETLFSMTEAEIRFDIAENWTTSREVGGNEVGLYQVALHEIGHVLGLNHTSGPGTIMYASDISDLSGLTPGDIAGAQAFYGPAQGVSTPDPDPEPTPEPEPVDGISGTSGNDMIAAKAGDDVIDGKDGFDTLSLSGNQSQYTLTFAASGLTLADRTGHDGTDTLVSIERLAFQGDTFDLGSFDGIAHLNSWEFASIVELYIAYFNRAPDAVGLAFWGNAYAEGMGLEQMAALFIDQPETRATYPDSMSDAEFALTVYDNVLGRVPDVEGFAFWVNALSRGDVGRDTFILSVLEGAKADFPPGASAEFITQVMKDRDYLADKADLGAYFAVHRGMSDVDDAAHVMGMFDGSNSSLQDAMGAVDMYYADALSAEDGAFLMPLVGVLDVSYDTF